MNRTRDAFTLIELLVVISIIMLLAGLLFPALGRAKEVARKTKAKHEVKQLDTAWKSVQSDYRTWDNAWTGASGNIGNLKAGATAIPGTAQTMDKDAVAYLNGGSSKGTLYLELDASMVNGFMDPWWKDNDTTKQKYYRFSIGASSVSVPTQPLGAGTTPLDRSVACWSMGGDFTEGTPDDVMSWQ